MPATTGLTFKIGTTAANATAIAANKASYDGTKYVVTVPTMTVNKDYALVVSKAGLSDYTKTVTLFTPDVPRSVSVSGNPDANSSKINIKTAANVTVYVREGAPWPVPGTVTVELTDSKGTSVKATKEITAHGDMYITGIDTTSLADGNISVYAWYSDGVREFPRSPRAYAVKTTVAPTITNLTVDRKSANEATFSFSRSESPNANVTGYFKMSYYYLVLDPTDAAPSADDIEKARVTAIARGHGFCDTTATVDVSGLTTGKEYKLYLVLHDGERNFSEVSEALIASDT